MKRKAMYVNGGDRVGTAKIYATLREKELEDKLKIAVSALKRVDNIAYEIDNKEINDIACTALEQLGELK